MSCQEYRVFLEEFHTDEDLLTIKVGPYRLNESEILGEVINWTLQYLSENKCPTKLSAPITRNVVETIQNESRKDPQLCGYDENLKTFDPSKLQNLVILALKTFCQRLLDNVELNKILPELSGKDYTPLYTTGAIRNKRRAMEDRHICIDDFNETYCIPNASKANFYAVFDGHDGCNAAYYSAAQLPYLLASSPLYPLNPAEAMRQSFRGTDLAFVQKTYQQSLRGGTTAVCALYLPEQSRLYVGWVGDSKALLAKQGKIMQIVKPHKPEDPKEKKRIFAAGGTVIDWGGMWRVDGLLNLSRAIGDSKCKPHVTADPDIVGLELDKNEDFLVLACDGLWDYVAEDKVAEIIYEQLNDDSENLNKIPQKLIDKSKQEGSTDNITIVIVFLKDPYQIVKNTCTIEIMEPAFDNCNIGEFTNSEQVLSTNANTTQIDFSADQSKEFFDDHQHQKQNSNSKQLRQQFNDGLNNFLQDHPNNICTNMMTNLNKNQFELKNNFEQMNEDGQQQFDDKFLNDFTKNTMSTDNDNIIDELTKGETPTDFEQDVCADVTDDIAMVTTENSEHSTISHSKDTLPLSDNFNPFDNKLSFENRDEYNPGDNIGYLCDNDDNYDSKSTPMISPDSEEIMNQGSDDMNDLISPEYEQPIVEELASGVEFVKQTDNSESVNLHEHKPDFDNDFIQTNGHLSPEKHMVYEEQAIYHDQQQHSAEANPDDLKGIDYHNEELQQNDFMNISHNKEEHQNEIFGLNSIKENHFESNYGEEVFDLVHNNQHIDEEKPKDIPIDTNISNSDNFNEITDQSVEENNIVVEEKFNKNFSSENDLNPNFMPQVEQQIIDKSEKELEIELGEQILHNLHLEEDEIKHEIEQSIERNIEQPIEYVKEQQTEHEKEQLIEPEGEKQTESFHQIDEQIEHENQQPIEDEREQQSEPYCEQQIQSETENTNITDFREGEVNHMKEDEYFNNNMEEQNAYFDSELQNTENYPIQSQELLKERPQEIPEERPQELLEQRPQELLEERSQELLEERPQELLEERPQELLEERPQALVEDRPQELLEERQQELLEGPQELLEERPQLLEEQPQELLENLPEELQERPQLPEEQSQELLEERPQELLGERQHELLEERPQQLLEELSQEFPKERLPEQFPEEKHQNFEDDGFAEQEFVEHDNFDEKNIDQSVVPQNLSVGAEIESNPVTEFASQQQERLESCDESEDECKYMRLKEGEGEKETKKIEALAEIDNREIETIDLTKSIELIKESIQSDNSTDNIQNSPEEKKLPTEISLEESRELSNQSKQSEILSSSPKPIAINLNITPIATDLDDDMNSQLNPEAKEFIPLSPPITTGNMNIFLEGDKNNGLMLNNGDGVLKKPQQHLVGDDVVSQSPRKGTAINMDEIFVPEQTEFDIEVRDRPHEILDSTKKLCDSTVAAIEEIIDIGSNGDVQQELYQELNLKEAMHGSEKEEHILSPTDVDFCDQTGITNPIFNPVAEFENIDMKDSIYIEKSSSNNQEQQQHNEYETNEDILNRVQVLPGPFDSNINLSSEFVRKEDLVSNENEKDIISPSNEVVSSILPVNGVSSQLQNIADDLSILKLSSDDTTITESPNKNALGIDLKRADAAAVAIAATTITAAGVTAASILRATDDKIIKAKVAEKNLKNKMMVKSPKVPEKKLSATTVTAAATTKTTLTTSAQPKKITSTSSKTSVISSSKPKTLTVSTAPAPKTLTFPRPRTAPANITAAAKNVSSTAGGITGTVKSRIDSSKPAPIKKPIPNKTSTIESVKSNVSKTGVSAKSSVTSRTSATNTLAKPRPASATTNGSASAANVTTKTTTNQLRPTSVKGTTRPPLSPRGTFTSALRKTEAIKSPTKSTTTTITSTASTGRIRGPTTTTTTSRTTTTTAPKLSVRKLPTTTKTNSPSAKLSSSSTAPPPPAVGVKKIPPIKRPVKKEIENLTEEIKAGVNGTSSVVMTNTIISTTIEIEQPKLNGVTPAVD